MPSPIIAARKAIADEAFASYDFAKEKVTFSQVSDWRWTEPNPLRFERDVFVDRGGKKQAKKTPFFVTFNEDGTLEMAFLKPKKVRTPRFEKFEEEFEPVEHEDTATGNPILLETYGPEFEQVKATDPAHVWTVVEGDMGELYVCAGLRFVNRLNYITTKKPWVTELEVFHY